MAFGTKILPGMLVALALSLPARAGDTTADTVIASVNGTDITVGHMIATRQTLPDQYQSLPDEVLFEGILEQLIQQAVLAQSVGDTLSKTAMLTIENETRAVKAGAAVERIVEGAVTEEALKEAYADAYAEAEPEPEYNASHILVATEDEARDLIDLLDNGRDFAELAAEFSTGPSGPNGGALGWFGPGMMVPEFEDAVRELEVGGLSEPVETQFGWHIVILNDKRIKDAPALDEVRNELQAQVEQQAVADAIEALTAEAEVSRADLSTIDTAVLSDTDLIAN